MAEKRQGLNPVVQVLTLAAAAAAAAVSARMRSVRR
jgi:hypothetical protein